MTITEQSMPIISWDRLCPPDKRAELAQVAEEVRAWAETGAPIIARAHDLVEWVARRAEEVRDECDAAGLSHVDTFSVVDAACGRGELFTALAQLAETVDPDPRAQAVANEYAERRGTI